MLDGDMLLSVTSHKMTTTMAVNILSTAKYVLTDWFDDNEQVEMAAYVRGGPGWIIGVVIAYLFVVLFAGPRFMRNREPFQLHGVIKVYNLLNIAANVVVFAFGVSFTSFGLTSFMCHKGSNQFDRVGVYYGYFLLKVSRSLAHTS